MAKVIDPFEKPRGNDDDEDPEGIVVHPNKVFGDEAARDMLQELMANLGLGGDPLDNIISNLMEAAPLGLILEEPRPMDSGHVRAIVEAAFGDHGSYVGMKGNPDGSSVHRIEVDGHAYFLYLYSCDDTANLPAEYDLVWENAVLETGENFALVWPEGDVESRLGGEVTESDLLKDEEVVAARTEVTIDLLRPFHDDNVLSLIDLFAVVDIEAGEQVDALFSSDDPYSVLLELTADDDEMLGDLAIGSLFEQNEAGEDDDDLYGDDEYEEDEEHEDETNDDDDKKP